MGLKIITLEDQEAAMAKLVKLNRDVFVDQSQTKQMDPSKGSCFLLGRKGAMVSEAVLERIGYSAEPVEVAEVKESKEPVKDKAVKTRKTKAAK